MHPAKCASWALQKFYSTDGKHSSSPFKFVSFHSNAAANRGLVISDKTPWSFKNYNKYKRVSKIVKAHSSVVRTPSFYSWWCEIDSWTRISDVIFRKTLFHDVPLDSTIWINYDTTGTKQYLPFPFIQTTSVE